MPDHAPLPPPDDASVLDLLVSSADSLAPRDQGPCLDENLLAAFADGSLGAGAREAVERHLSLCGACREIASALASPQDPLASAPPEAEGGYPRPFGPYTLLRRIGGGGMGDVFEAVHAQRGRREALKQLRAGLDDDTRAIERFLREIRALSGVRHEGIVTLLDSGVIDGISYFTMPFLPGPSFEHLVALMRAPGADGNALLDSHRVAPAPVAAGDPRTTCARRIAAEFSAVARALSELHRTGMVHRDVKPSNLILDDHGRPVLTDFGLIRFDGSRMTLANEAVGTPAYMAPEQLDGSQAVDARTDVYGVGASLFEMLALTRPYAGARVAETIASMMSGPPARLEEAAPWLPPDFAVVVGRCMQRLPRDRYPDMESLARDLDALSRGEPIEARPLSGAVRAGRALRRRRLPLAIAATLLAALALLAHSLPGHISVRSLPGTVVLLDSREIGRAPLVRHRVAAGAHTLELRREGFHPLVRTIELGRLGTYELDLALTAIDPADPASLALVASATGIDLATVDARATRSGADLPPVVTLSPRGTLREAPTEIRLWADDVAEGVTVRLVGDGETLEQWTPADFLRESVLLITADLAPGVEYSIDLGGGLGGAAFRILGREDARRIGDELDRLARRFAEGDAMAELIATEFLLGRGFWSEALARARAHEERFGTRPEIARMGLAALDRSGLRDAAFWTGWADALVEGGR